MFWGKTRNVQTPKGVTRTGPGKRKAVLIDVSGSMTGVYDILGEELATAESQLYEFGIWVFADTAMKTDARNFISDSGKVGGCTEMQIGLRMIAEHDPDELTVMSDGFTSSAEQCLDIVAEMRGITHAIASAWGGSCVHGQHKVGEGDFMQCLAHAGRGHYCPIFPNRNSWSIDPNRLKIAMAKTIGYLPRFHEIRHAPRVVSRTGAPATGLVSAGPGARINVVRR